jgi:hypothetical protein
VTAAFYPQKDPLVLISVRGRVNPRVIVRMEVLGELRNSMTSSGLEIAIFGFAAQYFNHQHYRVPQGNVELWNSSKFSRREIKVQCRKGQSVSVLNHHVWDVLWSRGMDPLFLKLGPRRRWVVSLKLRLIYAHWLGRRLGPVTRLDSMNRWNISAAFGNRYPILRSSNHSLG